MSEEQGTFTLQQRAKALRVETWLVADMTEPSRCDMPVKKTPLEDFKPQKEPRLIRDAAGPFSRDRHPEEERKALEERDRRREGK